MKKARHGNETLRLYAEKLPRRQKRDGKNLQLIRRKSDGN